MESELNMILKSVPTEVKFNEIVEIDKMDERISAVGALCANTIGVYEDYIEFCPDNEPPLKDEELSWIWVLSPDFGN